MNLFVTTVAAYLIGGLPFGYWFVRLTLGADIRTMGSGNIGATNVQRTAGTKAGVVVLLLDVLKGFAAVYLAAIATQHNNLAVALAGCAVMVGHCYPVFLGFKGGKAVACFLGAFAYLTPVPVLAVIAVFVATVAFSKFISLGSLVGALLFPLFVWLFQHPDAPILAASVFASVLVIFRHKGNYRAASVGNGECFFSKRQEGVKRLAVLGAGSWGTALAIALAPRFEVVRLWGHDAARAEVMQWRRENKRYLPGFKLPAGVVVSGSLPATLAETEIILSVVPSRHLRAVLREAAAHIPKTTAVISATKGIEEGTLSRMTEVIAQTLKGAERIAVLSGPTFAREVAAGEPAAVVIAAEHAYLAEEMQLALATPALRFYASTDVVGVEIGAALKNVIAIGAGICRGLGLGSNSVAALITRGLSEITRLALVMDGSPRTLSGLAGLGDLVLTATGDLSRNRTVGVLLGQGQPLSQILAESPMVAEGVSTCRAAYHLGQRYGVDLPIIQRMYQVLYEGKEVRMAIRELMERPLTSE